MKLLTVSIAAYNVEKYLEKCLNSLNDDRFKDDIEVLIIDDGSKDNTKKIAEEFQRKSPDTFHYMVDCKINPNAVRTKKISFL
ncbi:glycosyltransferase family 2 protein [Lactiplantibacillus plantarum]